MTGVQATPALRILIVGGYGGFGTRLAELLEDEARLTLLIGGRSLQRAQSYCASRRSACAELVPVEFDRERFDSGQLAALRPSVVVDASGPFQHYGNEGYRLIHACVAHRIHYLDLADGAEFVAGVAQFDEAARRAGVYVLSGVSSCPALTAAVVARLSEDMTHVVGIEGGIAPSPFARVGSSVLRAIASYAGRSVSLRRGGRTAKGWPLIDSTGFVVAAPGHVPLGYRRFSLVDVPDLHLLPRLWPTVQDVWMGAGPVPASLHWTLTGFAWLVRLRLLRSIERLARPMRFATLRVRRGEHRGGMFVRVEGRSHDGRPIVREWHLLAEGDDGPFIPSMAAASLIRKTLEGLKPPPGARTATADVALSDYEPLFARRAIHTGVREREPSPRLPLYQRMLGPAWQQLPAQIRELHTVTGESVYVGQGAVERGRSPIGWLAAAVVGFPKAGVAQRVSVTLTAEDGAERWVRRIGSSRFQSLQSAGRGRYEWLLREQFGPVAVYLALVVEGATLRYIVRKWTLLGIPMPMFLAPRTTAVESVEDGRFRFDVQIRHPCVGTIVHYRGVLGAVQM